MSRLIAGPTHAWTVTLDAARGGWFARCECGWVAKGPCWYKARAVGFAKAHLQEASR
jgi:hypothetical protein